jgi:hypothetical protein
MSKGRLEAFSDGVVAILITIMVLELRAPHGTDWTALRPLVPHLLTYVLSFVLLGIYWNNHHHMLHMADRITGRILWANLHLLFWLSLVPFVTGWMGENHFASVPTAAYGVVLVMAAIAYTILSRRGRGRRREGQAVGGLLRARDRAGVRQPVVLGCALRSRGVDVADARSADRVKGGRLSRSRPGGWQPTQDRPGLRPVRCPRAGPRPRRRRDRRFPRRLTRPRERLRS